MNNIADMGADKNEICIAALPEDFDQKLCREVQQLERGGRKSIATSDENGGVPNDS